MLKNRISRLALAPVVAGVLSALAPAALAQTSITVDYTGGNSIRTRFTVELRDASGNLSGKAVVDHPGMGIRAVEGFVPQNETAALEQAVWSADLLNQPADEWTGANPDVSTQTFTDQDGNYCILHPMFGPNGIDVTQEMTALAQAVDAARTAMIQGGPPAAAPFLSYTWASGWIGQVTLDVLSDGSCHLHGELRVPAPGTGPIDLTGQLTSTQLQHLQAFMQARAAIWANYTGFGRMIPDGSSETITYTDANGNAKAVTRWGNAPAKPTWNALERFLKGEAKAIDPALNIP